MSLANQSEKIVRSFVERMSSARKLTGVISRTNASPEEGRAVDDLLGRRSTVGKQLTLNCYTEAEGSSVLIDPQSFNAAWAAELVQSLRNRGKLFLRNKSSHAPGRPEAKSFLTV